MVWSVTRVFDCMYNWIKTIGLGCLHSQPGFSLNQHPIKGKLAIKTGLRM